MSSKLYDWQTELYDRWVMNGRRGVLKAVPGAGKTRAGATIIRRVASVTQPVLIVAPTKTIIRQWERELIGVPNVTVATYFGANKLVGVQRFSLVVFDECHSLLSPVRARALGIERDGVLGLSATPGESVGLLGGVIMDIGWDKANIAPFSITYVVFQMTPQEQAQYQRLTNDLKRVFQHEQEERKRGRFGHEEIKMMAIMKRRGFVYTLPKRVDVAIETVLRHPDDRIILFSERLEQCNELHARLWASGVPSAIFTSEKDSIQTYIDRQVRVLVTSKMIKEGFDDPSTTLGILVSTPLSERNQVQTVGRIIRSFPSKIANVFILLARDTSDTKLLRTGIKGRVIDENGLPVTLPSVPPRKQDARRPSVDILKPWMQEDNEEFLKRLGLKRRD
jgi:RNA polymerase primary sigma factor